jgi:sirohydrochlorin cobaltochelatase
MSKDGTRGLLLVGHGSHYNADSSDPARRQARVILERRLFDEVRLAFWKEEPALCHGLGVTCADEVFVVPFFISSGYFTEQVVRRSRDPAFRNPS